MNHLGFFFVLVAACSTASCQCDGTEFNHCRDSSSCPTCSICFEDRCRLGLDPCDGEDNDCDGETDEGCGELCEGLVCESPPERICLDSDHLRYYRLPGMCVDGSCEYPPTDIICPEGCERSACIGDACIGLTCTGDGNPCTDDGCDPLSGCTQTPNNAPCEDGDLCSGPDVCRDGMCVVGGERDCDDGLACTSEVCDTAIGCVIIPDDLACDDLDPCTHDICDTNAGCLHPFNTAACEDGDPCTMEDTCDHGVCSGAPRDLDFDGFVDLLCGGDDCDDDDEATHPGAEEICDGSDNDCDGLTDINGEDLCSYHAICHRGVMTECPATSGPTVVPGVLDEDAIWCAAGSPFLIETNAAVLDGFRLTVGPCLDVLASDGVELILRGDFVVSGSKDQPAIFRSDSAAPTRTSWKGLSLEKFRDYFYDITGARFMHAERAIYLPVISVGHLGISRTRFEMNRHGIDGYTEDRDNYDELEFYDNGYGITGGGLVLTGGAFVGNDVGMDVADVIVSGVSFSGNAIGIRGSLYWAEDCYFENNEHPVVPGADLITIDIIGCTLINNANGILVGRRGSRRVNDSVLCNNGTYDIETQSDYSLDATNNWWCTTDPQAISARIYDVHDDASLGQVVFEPFLTEAPPPVQVPAD